MPTFMLAPLAGRYLSFEEREEIAVLKAQVPGVRQIARRLGRDPSTISRELRRNAATRGGRLDYRASGGQGKAEMMARRPKTAKLVANQRLREYVVEDTCRSPQRPAIVAPGNRCCIHQLSPVNTLRGRLPSGPRRPGCCPRWAPSGTPTTTP